MILIVLAAGRGKRIRDFTSKPKCLIELYNKPLINYLLDNLNVKFKKIIFVIGYKKKFLKNRIKKLFPRYKKFFFVENKHYVKTNNSYSLFLTKKYIDDDVIFVNADLFLSENIANLLKKNKKKNFILLDLNKKNFFNKDLTKISFEKFKVTNISKKMQFKKINATAPGLYGFDKNTFFQHLAITKKNILKNNLNEGFIEPIQKLLKKNIIFYPLKLKKNVISKNINSPKDLLEIYKLKNFIKFSINHKNINWNKN